METEEGPTDPTDSVEETLLAHNASADSIEMPAEVIGTPPRSGELTPIGTSSPVVAPRDSGPDPGVGNRESDPQEPESDEVEEKFSPANEVLEPRGMEATPAMTSRDRTGYKGGIGAVGQTVSTTKRCVIPMDLLTVDSPSRPRTSPKRKQLSPPEGSEVAADWENTVKRHCSSMQEHPPL